MIHFLKKKSLNTKYDSWNSWKPTFKLVELFKKTNINNDIACVGIFSTKEKASRRRDLRTVWPMNEVNIRMQARDERHNLTDIRHNNN